MEMRVKYKLVKITSSLIFVHQYMLLKLEPSQENLHSVTYIMILKGLE